MHGEFRRNRRRVGPITRFLPEADLLMQADAVPARHSGIHDLLIHGMEELITRRHRPVGPGLSAHRPHEPPLAGQGRIARFKSRVGLCDPGGRQQRR